MNIKNIISAIYERLSGTLTTQELLILAKSIEKLKVGNVQSVADFGGLISLVTAPEGTLVFVESNDELYVRTINSWNLVYSKVPAELTGAWAWGSNANGRLGNNTTTNTSSPVSVVGGYTDWIQVAGCNDYSLGLRANGTAWSWGNNGSGNLGDGTTTARSSPVSVVGGFTDWIQVAGGGSHSLGLRADGTAWAWGFNGSGRLGDNTATNRSSPVSVVGGYTDWIQVSAGLAHSLGLRANGTAWAWGSNSGNLGDGTTTARSSPVSVVGGFTDWIQVAGGGSHSLGLRADGTAWAWGTGNSGRLGDNTATNTSSPVSVVGGFTDWIQVSAGNAHSLGIRANGTAWAWGDNGSGRLGDNSGTARSSPVSVVGGFTDWIQVSAGNFANFCIGLRANGTAWAWGDNANGQLGNNTTTSTGSPVSVVGGFTDWIQVSGSTNHSLALKQKY
jgi:alpha-tubulin suppressor-like RCC1 family protein